MGLLLRGRSALLSHLRDPLYANGYALVANSALASLLGFAFWTLAARRYPADTLGVGAAVISAATMAALLGKAGFDVAIIRYGPPASRRYVMKLLAYAGVATLALTSLFGIIVLALSSRGVQALAPLAEPAVAAGFLLLAGATGIAWVLDAYFISEQAALHVLWRNLAFNGVKLLVPLLAFGIAAARAVPLAWGLGLAASLAVSLCVLPRQIARHPKEGATAVPRLRVGAYALKNYALNLSEFLPGLVLPLLVLAAVGPEGNAHFYMAWTVATVGFLASKAIAQSSFAALVRADDPLPALCKGFLLSGLVLAPGVLILLLGGGFVLGVFGAAYSAEGATLLRLLALSIVPVALVNLFLAYLKARHAGWELTLVPAVGLAAFLALVPFALARSGIEGVGIAWLIVQTTMGAYAAARLMAMLRRNHHDTLGTVLRRRPHQG